MGFIVQSNFVSCPTLQYTKTHLSNIPAFHQFNWGEAPNWFHFRFKIWLKNANNNMMGSIGSKCEHRISLTQICCEQTWLYNNLKLLTNTPFGLTLSLHLSIII